MLKKNAGHLLPNESRTAADRKRKTAKKCEAYFDTLDPEAKQSCGNRLEVTGVRQCPYEIPKSTWKDDPTKLPNVQYPNIFSINQRKPVSISTVDRSRRHFIGYLAMVQFFQLRAMGRDFDRCTIRIIKF